MKEKGVAYQRPARYEAIRIPSNTPIGVIVGAFGFVLGLQPLFVVARLCQGRFGRAALPLERL